MPTFTIDDWANQTAREVDVGYDDLDERYVALLAMSGDDDAARWLQAHITAAGDFDESKHPRGGDPANPGRFSPAEGGGAEKAPTSGGAAVFTSPKAIRDMIVEQNRGNFLRELGDYPQTVKEAQDRGAFPPNGDGSFAQTEYWRYATGMLDRPGWEFNLARINAYVNNDPRALGTLRSAVTRGIIGDMNLDSVRPEFAANVREAVDKFNADPRVAALQEKYGAPDIVVAATAPGRALDSLDTPTASTSPDGNRITIYDNAWIRPDPSSTYEPTREGTIPSPDRGPLTPGGSSVANTTYGGSMLSTLDHEFGHSVWFHLPEERRQEWNTLYDTRHAQYDAEEKAAGLGAPDFKDRNLDEIKNIGERTISYYAMNSGRPREGNQQEGFAETFAAVMHPDYNRDLFDSSNHALLDFADRIVHGE